MDSTGIIEDLRERFKTISKRSHFLDFRARTDPSASITAKTLDDYMESNGFNRLENAWIELSASAALQHLQLLIRGEQMNYFGYGAPAEVPRSMAEQFVGLFTSNHRFFCNGLTDALTEHPVLESSSIETVVLMPFPTPRSATSLYGGSVPLSNKDIYECLPFGLVAVDDLSLGFCLLNLAL